jgi:hypothetical protein
VEDTEGATPAAEATGVASKAVFTMDSTEAAKAASKQVIKAAKAALAARATTTLRGPSPPPLPTNLAAGAGTSRHPPSSPPRAGKDKGKAPAGARPPPDK